MKRTTTIFAALVSTFLGAALLAGGAEFARFTPAKPNGSVTIKGTSTLHAWEMKGTTIGGTIQTDPDAWKGDGQKPALVNVTIPVASIHAEHERMDRLMSEALKADKNPNINYVMTSASLVKGTADAFVVRTSGKLTIAGATKDVTMDLNVQRGADNRYVVTGEAPIRMSDFGIKPPVTMMGTLKTGNDVVVAFRWIVERS